MTSGKGTTKNAILPVLMDNHWKQHLSWQLEGEDYPMAGMGNKMIMAHKTLLAAFSKISNKFEEQQALKQ